MKNIPWWLIAIPVVTVCLAFLIWTWREPDLLVGLLKTLAGGGAGVALWESGKKVLAKRADA